MPFTQNKHHSATSALAWNYAGMAAKMFCQFGIGIMIARMLGPEPYGLVAAGTIVISLAGLMAEGGLSAALIRYQDAEENEIAGAFWTQLSISCLVFVCLYVAAPIFVTWLEAPAALEVLRVLALMFPINAVASISLALHRRRLDMRPVQIAMIVSYLMGYGGVGLVLAFKGAGVWALVWAQLAQSILNATILFMSGRPPLRHPVLPKRLLGFGGWMLLCNLTAWAHGNLVNVFLAKSFGIVALGHYNRLALITDSTVSIIGGPLQQTVFPAIARAANNPVDCRRVIISTFRLVGLIFFPAMAILFFFPGEVVGGLFGEKFLPQAEILLPLSVATIGQIWVAIVTLILAGLGKPKVQWISQMIALPVVIALLWALSQHSFLALCWGFCAGIWLRSVLILVAALSVRAFSIGEVVEGFGPSILPSVVGLVGAWVGFAICGDLSDEFRLLVAGMLALLGWSGAILIFRRWVLPESALAWLRGRLWFTCGLTM